MHEEKLKHEITALTVGGKIYLNCARYFVGQ